MDEKPPIDPSVFPPSFLGSIPPTPPEVLQQMHEGRTEHNHYAAIGRVAAAWSYFEAVIDSSSIPLAHVNSNVGVCFTAQIPGSARKLDAYISLARLSAISQKLIRDLCEFAKTAQELSERRNRVIHDVWFFDHPNDPQRLEASARKILRLERIPVSTDKLLNLANEINQKAFEFNELSERVIAERSTLPETSPPELVK
jgi:hypothetical protein